MGASMFDIGVNLTSSQFAKDRDDVVARAFAAGVKGMLLTGTNIHESQQALKLARRYPIVGRRLASIPMTAVSGHPRLKTPLLRWRTSQKSSLSVSAGWISIVIFPRRRSRSVPFRRSYKLPPNYRCQSLCTAGTRMSDFWHCLIPGWIVFLVQYCTALPVHASKCRTVWTEDSISVLPGGFATNDADLSYVNSYRLFQRKSY